MNYKFIVLSALFIFYGHSVFAGDEFGARFTGRAPVALGESIDKSSMEIAGPVLPKGMDLNPAAIEPAAGDSIPPKNLNQIPSQYIPETIEQPNP